MAFSIVMGVPEMLAFWESLQSRYETGEASKDEAKTYKLLRKTLKLISNDPKYPGLHTHEISELTARYGVKVFQSYCENRNPRAMRIYWVYGPKKDYITIIGLEPHPNDAKGNAYKKICLSKMGKVID
ncbi:MAG: hypothetical protein II467_03215 [Bacilli bacterium]|nr:hypothetical protein [Bacilli bacterium]MBQ4255844.1 hypothetical protein [Bacilli bacterium]